MVFMLGFSVLNVSASLVFFTKPTKYPGNSFVSGNATLGSRYNTGLENWNTRMCEIHYKDTSRVVFICFNVNDWTKWWLQIPTLQHFNHWRVTHALRYSLVVPHDYYTLSEWKQNRNSQMHMPILCVIAGYHTHSEETMQRANKIQPCYNYIVRTVLWMNGWNLIHLGRTLQN